MFNKHVVHCEKVVNRVLKTTTYRWKCDKCSYLGVIILVDDDIEGEFIEMDDGLDSGAIHVCKKLKVTL